MTYKLTRLEDNNGRLNWKITPITDINTYIRWDVGAIERDVAQLKVGESKIFEV